jgi:hypothetical protein
MPRKATKSIAIFFNGIVFRRYPNAKQWSHRTYYTPHSGHRRRGVGALHQEIWKAANGTIPAGKYIHHKDGNSLNNTLSNLACVSKQTHDRKHSQVRSKRAKTPEALEQLDKIRPLASKWHRSDDGRAWHVQHGKKTWRERKLAQAICTHCGISYATYFPTRSKFCGSRCRQRAYAADGRYAGRKRRRKTKV